MCVVCLCASVCVCAVCVSVCVLLNVDYSGHFNPLENCSKCFSCFLSASNQSFSLTVVFN